MTGEIEIERSLLRAMMRSRSETGSRKSDVILRYALREDRRWNDEIEAALCNAGTKEPTVIRYYQALRRLALETPFADGAGDLALPAGPRYTECWITDKGVERLSRMESLDAE